MATASTATNLLEFRTELSVAIERVFAALTEGEHLGRWFCDTAESVAAPGGRVCARWTRLGASPEPFDGRWVVFQPPVACAYEGGHSGYPDGYAGRVGFELASRGSGTVLITRHRLPARPDYETILVDYRNAWPRALARLVEYLDPERAARMGAETPTGAGTRSIGVFAAIETAEEIGTDEPSEDAAETDPPMTPPEKPDAPA